MTLHLFVWQTLLPSDLQVGEYNSTYSLQDHVTRRINAEVSKGEIEQH